MARQKKQPQTEATEETATAQEPARAVSSNPGEVSETVRDMEVTELPNGTTREDY